MSGREDSRSSAERQFGPYRLSQLIATGGMAEIHLAKTRGIEGFEKYVALKMIHPNFSSDDHFIQMLIDEAKISVQLQHVNIAHTFDLGRVGDTYYIAMEFVDGSDLFRILRKSSEQDRYMPIEMAVYVAKEVAAGLDYAHHKRDSSGRSMGIVHRDISPQNVLISHAGEVKIVDFGIAKATMRAKQTAVGVIKGKYYYMSPEQAWGDPLDHRTDIFSAGILLYEMLTGQMLYLEEDMTKLLEMVRKADIPPPSSKRREVPRELDKIVMRALAKKPDGRWPTAQEYGTELEKFLHSYAPDFKASKLATFVAEVVGPPAQRPAPPRPPPRISVEDSSPRVTRGIERKSIAVSRSEFTDENSVIYDASQGAPQRSVRSDQAKSEKVSVAGRVTSPSMQRAAFPGDRLTTPSGGPSVSRPPPLPPSGGGGVKPLAARLAAASSQPEKGTIDIDDLDLEPIEESAAGKRGHDHSADGGSFLGPAGGGIDSTGDSTSERTADVLPPSPPADEEPTVLDVAGLAGRARGPGSSTRPMEAARGAPPAPSRPSAGRAAVDPVANPVASPVANPVANAPRSANATPPPRVSGARPIISVDAVLDTQPAVLPPLLSPSLKASRRTPAAVPILEMPKQSSGGISMPLAPPAEDTRVSAPASTVWPPTQTTGDDDGDEVFGLKVGGRFTRRQLLLGAFLMAGILGLGALAVAVVGQPTGPAYGTVEVISIPPGAHVLVEGKDLGVTPLPLARVAVDRPLRLRVELPQYEPWEGTEQLGQVRHVKVVASLRPILGRLRVDSNPVGAEVFVNNRSVGLTPLDRGDQSPFVDGTIEVRKQGFKPLRQALAWKGGRDVRLSFDLVPAKD